MNPAVTEQLIAELRRLLGDRVTTASAMLEHHSRGESCHTPAPPDVVVFPHTRGNQRRRPGLRCARCADRAIRRGHIDRGQVLALQGGVCVDLSQMNKVLRVSPDDLDAAVEAGVTHRQLNKRLENTGLMFSVDPGADATLGGMAATGASGTTTVRYGTMRENIRGLTVVLADGRVITTGSRARKSSAGFDLTRLFVGSEGTLGIITEITLRLHPLRKRSRSRCAGFPTSTARSRP
jgi:D-lactate dehydrogenase (cytochrome)